MECSESKETSSLGYEIKLVNEIKGRGLFATKAYNKGDVIFEETPLVCAQFSWNSTYGYLTCEHCMRPLETAEENVIRLSGGSITSLPFPEHSPTDKTTHVECEQCQKKYCSPECRNKSFLEYHKTLCYNQFNDNCPLFILEETWKKMHYPPESFSIVLIAKLFARIEQQSQENSSHLVEQISQFFSRSSEDCSSLEDKLGTEFGARLEILRNLLQQCFPSQSNNQWLTEKGFQWLFTMIAVNGQGIGTSVFSQWVENVHSHNGDDEQMESQIDKIYEVLFEYSGCEFLNNEGSALYKLQSSANHSCTPNGEIKFPYSNFVLNLVAIEDIQPGDEIHISYMDEDLLMRGRETRNNYLRSNYYFTCTCAKCESQIGEPQSEDSGDEDMSPESDESG